MPRNRNLTGSGEEGNVVGIADEQPSSGDRVNSGANDPRRIRRRALIALLGVLAICLAFSGVLLLTRGSKVSVRQAELQAEGNGRWLVKQGDNRVFTFRGLGDRVFVPNAPEFNFGAGQDFSVEAWIKAYPAASRSAQQTAAWISAHPSVSKFVPRRLAQEIAARAADNDFGVMPIVDKHHPRSTIEAVGYQLYLDHGRLACQLAGPPMRPMGFQNFVSPAPNLHDGRWHHVVLTVERNSATGGKLYVDGRLMLTFDPTGHAGDLSNVEPLRIGNHANPSLRCYFKGSIQGVLFERRARQASEIAASHRAGRSSR